LAYFSHPFKILIMKKYTWSFVALFMLVGITSAIAQPKITVQDIWRDYKFIAQSVPGFNFQNDGVHYTRQEGNKVVQYDLTTGEQSAVLFDAENVPESSGFAGRMASYEFSADESKLIISSEVEPIYRHSSRAKFFVVDLKTKVATAIHDGRKVRYATLNPNNDKVAFVYKNNLYYTDLMTNETVQITQDGQYNSIINGATDWVYEEEFAIWKGFDWSPDGAKIAFYRFDESAVKEFTMTNYRDGLYPEYVTFKYPKVGEQNAKVQVFIYDLKKGKQKEVDLGNAADIYVPRIKWANEKSLIVFKMNRHQNDLQLLLANAKNGKTELLLKETNPYYIDIHDNLTFLEDGKSFVWTSEKDGYNHIYLYNMKGEEKAQLTKGNWEVTNFYGVDEANDRVFYQAAKRDAMQREIYSVNLKGKKDKAIIEFPGTNSVQFSSTFDYFVNTHSTINSPASYIVYDRKAKAVRTVVENSALASIKEEVGATNAEFFDFKTKDNVTLNGYMIKPPNFDSRKQYPVFMYLYGGPGSQSVTDSWKGQNYWWFQMLAQKGYVVACVDNRGTGGRGQEFKKMTYKELGKFETIDQIEAAKYLAKLPYTDANRVGIFGWSYGGYMSSLCLLKGNDTFKAAIAVAPVTNWKWYDSIYTERYMQTERENPSGYKDNSPVYFTDRLKGNYLLVHGMGDDNVHFQHTAEMANALIMNNKQFDTYFYPNKNHGIYGGPTREHLYVKMTNFLDEKLMNDDSPVGE